MSMPAFIQILLVGQLTPKTYEGRSYNTQEAECVLLDENGETLQIGVLRFSEKFQKEPPTKGLYRPVFSMVASPKDRKIGAVITDLQPVDAKSFVRAGPAAVSPAAAALKA